MTVLQPCYWMTAAAGEQHPGSAFLTPERYLTAAELAQLSTIRFAARRSDWLLGRWTVKSLIEKTTGISVFRLEVFQEAEGAPFICADGSRMEGSISISHRGGRAFCAYCPQPGAAVGADLEVVEPRSAGFERDYFTSGELAWLEDVPTRERPAAVALVWSLKEAALKALKKGLRLDTRVIEIQPGPPAWLDALLWHPAEITSALAAGPWRAVWKIEADQVWTLAALGEVLDFKQVI